MNRSRITELAAACAVLVPACGGGTSAEPDAAAADPTVDVTVVATDFDCVLKMTQVGELRVANLAGGIDGTVAAASSTTGTLRFPAGSLVQITPNEAMVKHTSGFDPSTNDWEFFFLQLDASATTILARGGQSTAGAMGMTCLSCHAMAPSQWDLICATGTDHSCNVTLPNDTPADVANLQNADPRCH
jgi:hypothetical protein